MRCLTVNIESIQSPLSSTAVGKNKELSVLTTNMNGIEADSDNSNVCLLIDADNDNTLLILGNNPNNKKVSITAALVCQVSLGGKYEYFYVTEGPLIVEEGYFRVRRR